MANNQLGIGEQIISELGTSAGFNISQFRAEMAGRGVLQSTRFLVFFTPPAIMRQNGNRLDSRFLTLRCEDINVPGVNFFTAENIRRHGFGEVERRPYLPQFNPVTMGFVVDRNADVVNYFDNWTNSIINYNRRDSNEKQKNKPYMLNYKDKYICPQMDICLYDEFYRLKARCTLLDAYPQTTSDIGMNWGATDTAAKYSVTMQYTDMVMDFENRTVRDVRTVTDIIGKITKIPSMNEVITSIAGKIEGRIVGYEELILNQVIN